MSSYFKIGESSDKESFDICPKLTYKQRLIGFAVCSIIGWVLTLFSFFTFKGLINHKPVPFAVLFSCGNLVCIFATCFLSGPKSQCKSMLKPARLITVIVFFVSLIATILLAILYPNLPLLLVCIVVQLCAYIWYTLSYIPFGQTLFKKCCSSLCTL